MAGETQAAELFKFDPADDLAGEHAAVLKHITDAMATLTQHSYHKEVPLNSLPAGQVLLGGGPKQSVRYLRAALQQVMFYDREADRMKAAAQGGIVAHSAQWHQTWGARRRSEEVVSALLRRSLPMTEADVQLLLEWCNSAAWISNFHYPVKIIAKAVERYLQDTPLTPPVRSAIETLAGKLRTYKDRDLQRACTHLTQLIAVGPAPEVDGAERPPARPVIKAAAGDPRVLRPLKKKLGLIDEVPDPPPARVLEPDSYPLAADSPLVEEHLALSDRINFASDRPLWQNRQSLDLSDLGRDYRRAGVGRLLVAAGERAAALALAPQRQSADYKLFYGTRGVFDALAKLEFAIERDLLFDLILFLSVRPSGTSDELAKRVIAEVKTVIAAAPLTDGERYALHLWRMSLIGTPQMGSLPEHVAELCTIIGSGAWFWLTPGDPFADLINDELARLPRSEAERWAGLMHHALSATSSKPSAKWLKTAGTLIDGLGRAAVTDALLRWFAEVPSPRTALRLSQYPGDSGTADVIDNQNADALRGLLWMAPLLDRAKLLPSVLPVTMSAYRKLPGVGYRAPKVGNAAIYALSQFGTPEAVGQLAVLKSRLKGGVQKELEKAFTAAATALKLPRDEIEELAVPAYGLSEVGRDVETFGDYSAEITIDGNDVAVTWRDANGKTLKSPPAKVKADHKEAFKELQQRVKDLSAMLPAQRDRLDAMALSQKRWPLAIWRERYLDHPLVGTLARRLIWLIGDTAVMWHDGKLVDLQGKVVDPPADATVSVWHPIGRQEEEILGWRAWLEKHEVRQPFKQAHREIYLLTDAERGTSTYSNRFAAHVLRQHQFNALCGVRGWKNKLRLLVDDEYPPASRELPQWGVRAEFWIEGIGDNYGTDTTDSGSYLRVATDQVRFYRIGAVENRAHASGGGYASRAAGPRTENINQPLQLDQVPPIVLSEILRDVDLFVGVASVGNDPTWQDGGPEGRFRAYWRDFSFGELNETAKTRRDVLQRLLPRMTRLAGKWELGERFLVIRGGLRTYKIHLGSGNILMEPNDQYLCIVPDRSMASTTSGRADVFLPFEGDSTLSIILSKALMLAADEKIKDGSIVSQIRRG